MEREPAPERDSGPPDSPEENEDNSTGRDSRSDDYDSRDHQKSVRDRVGKIVNTAVIVVLLLMITDSVFRGPETQIQWGIQAIIAFALVLTIVGMLIGGIIAIEYWIRVGDSGNGGQRAQQNRWPAKLGAGVVASALIGVILMISSVGLQIRVSLDAINSPTPYGIAKLLVVLLGFVALYLLTYYEISEYNQSERNSPTD
jgi:hypothetical protein